MRKASNIIERILRERKLPLYGPEQVLVTEAFTEGMTYTMSKIEQSIVSNEEPKTEPENSQKDLVFKPQSTSIGSESRYAKTNLRV